MQKTKAMTRTHPRWNEFCERLNGPEGCNFRNGKKGIEWTCDGGRERPFAVAILKSMGFDADGVRASLNYFNTQDGHCDCEILINVDRLEDEGA